MQRNDIITPVFNNVGKCWPVLATAVTLVMTCELVQQAKSFLVRGTLLVDRAPQSVSQYVIGSGTPRVFTRQRRHFSTLPGPE
jgi:hypothetical protein